MENQTTPKKSRGKKILFLLLIFLILLLSAFFFWRTFDEKKISGPLTPQKASIEKENEVSGTITSAGGVLVTRGSDGTLYSLTIPPNSVTLPKNVTLAPLAEVPLGNYKKSTAGKGVYVGPPGKGGTTFIRPAYLVIKPNSPMPERSPYGAAEWGRCNIGSRGFEPQICAAERGLAFNSGVEPGKIVIFSKEKEENMGNDNLYLSPTVPIGDEDTFVVPVWETGSYLADRVGREELKSFFEPTFKGFSDYVNKTELLSHWTALGGDPEPYKEEIKRFAREKKDYPREVLKAAIIAQATGEEETAQKRIEDLKTVIERNLGRVKGSFLPWPHYVGFLKQANLTGQDSGAASKLLLKIGLADLIASAEQKANLALFEKNTLPEDRGDLAEALYIANNYPPGTTSSALTEDPKGASSPAGSGPKSGSGGNFGGSGDSGGSGGGSSCAGVSMEACAQVTKDSSTCNIIAECERLTNLLDKCCPGKGDKGRERTGDLMKKMKDCRDLLVKKDLETFGMNSCDLIGWKKESDYVNPDDIPLPPMPGSNQP